MSFRNAHPTRASRQRQAGVATVLVLSLLAGLALMVAGIVGSASLDVRLLAAQRQQLQADALLEGGAHLLMRRYLAGGLAPVAAAGSAVVGNRLEFAGYQLEGSVYPVEALIDLRSVPAEILAQLFVRAGGMTAPRAARLAETVVRYRDAVQPGFAGGASGFTRVSDLMAVPGMPREVYDRVSFALRVSGAASAGLNPALLPSSMRQLLQAEDGAQSVGQAGGAAMPAAAAGSSLQITLSYQPDSETRLTRHFRMSTSESQGSLPWRMVQRFPLRVDRISAAGERGS